MNKNRIVIYLDNAEVAWVDKHLELPSSDPTETARYSRSGFLRRLIQAAMYGVEPKVMIGSLR
ncbi:MAG: hypothetical protein OXH70_17720 [Acidobacteria bacterium]|nr:hypothetical protein [Acidobacteriota bacterium]